MPTWDNENELAEQGRAAMQRDNLADMAEKGRQAQSFDELNIEAPATPAATATAKAAGTAIPTAEAAAPEVGAAAEAAESALPVVGQVAGGVIAAQQISKQASTTGSISQYMHGGSGAGGGGDQASGSAILAAINKLSGIRGRM